jgi:RNA polymerase-binding transcription factor DksA
VNPTPLPAAQLEGFRTLLLARMGERADEFARYSAALSSFDATPSSDATDRDRAVLALRTFCALEAVEEIGAALARIEAGEYGICQTCRQAIPLRRLLGTPQARSCVACPARAAHTAHPSAGPRLGPNRGERTGAVPQPSPVRSSLGPFRSAALETEARHGNAALR